MTTPTTTTIRELFFREAVEEKRLVNREDIERLLDYLNTSGDEGTQFDAKDFGAIMGRQGHIALDKVRMGIGKHVSAFSNTTGGLLALGICEIKGGNSGDKGQFFYKGAELARINLQHFQRVISTAVEPRPDFSVELVEMEPAKGGRKAKGVLLLYVEPSMNPPHQCVHNRVYYFRNGESSNPAPHSLVNALFGHRKQAKLELDLIKVTHKDNAINTKGAWHQRLLLRNRGNAPAFYTHLIVNIYPVLSEDGDPVLNAGVIAESSDGAWKVKEFLGSAKKNFMKFRFRASQEQIILPQLNEILFDFPVGSFQGAIMKVDMYCDGFEGHQEFKLY